MLSSGHCTVHPSREAFSRCRHCGCWLCENCVRLTPHGIFCSTKCSILFRIRSLGAAVLKAATAPLEGPWVVGLVGGLTALAIFLVALLAAQLVETSRPPAPPAPIPEFRLVETPDGLDLIVTGSPGAHAVVTDAGDRTRTVTLSSDGTAQVPKVFVPPEVDIPEPTPSPTTPPKTEPTAAPTPAPTARVVVAMISTPIPTPRPTPRPRQTAVLIPSPTPSPRPPKTRSLNAPPVLHLVTDSGPSIAITFDGGASSNRTAELLDLLQDLDIEATLFLTGQFIEHHPALVRRAVLAGHEVGNHTYSHPHLTTWADNHRHRTVPGMTRKRLIEELRKTEETFRRATGRPMAPLWRAPYGEENAQLRAWALEAGYLHVRWSSLEGRSLDSHDWVNDEHSGLYRDSKKIMDRLLAFPRLEGGIVLMHLATEREEAPWRYLPEFVEKLRRRGIEPCRVTTLLDQSRIWKPWLDRARTNHERNERTGGEK